MRKRFVILEHDHPFLHWDLMLEGDNALLSWRLLQNVVLDEWIPAERIAEHRMLYLDYEGPVSHNRGFVKRIHSGLFETSDTSDAGVQDDSAGEHFRLHDTSFADVAICRSSDERRCVWRFSRLAKNGSSS